MMKKSKVFLILFLGLFVLSGVGFVRGNVCDGGAIDCTDGGDGKCLEECENWVLGDKKDSDYYGKSCGMWKCAGKKTILLQSSEEGCSKSSSIKWIDNEEYNKAGYAGGNCVFESKKKFCAKTKDCPDMFSCTSQGKCDCLNGVNMKDGSFLGCCNENEMAIFGKDKYAKGQKLSTSVCCGQGVLAALLLPSKNDKYGGMFPTECCKVEEHNSYDYVNRVDLCCPKDKEWMRASEKGGECSSPCCSGDNDCSSFCEILSPPNYFPVNVRITKETCSQSGELGLGYCTSEEASESLSLDIEKTCITKEVKEGEPGFVADNKCAPKKAASIVCRSDVACGSACNGESADRFGNKLDVVDKKGCANGEEEKGDCVLKNKEICEKGKVCVEHIKFDVYPTEAKCENCPNSASFFGDMNVPSGVQDDMDIKINDENKREFTTENSFVTLTPEGFFKRLANLCEKCPAKESGKKLERVFLDTHGDEDGPKFVDSNGKKEQLTAKKLRNILNKDNKRLSKQLKNCIGEFVFLGCQVGVGLVDDVLAEELGINVTAGLTDNSGLVNGCRRGVKIPNPVTNPGNKRKDLIKTIYYLTKSDSLYPGFGEEVYQAKVINGSLGQVEIMIDTNDKDVLFASVDDENMPCSFSIRDWESFVITPDSQGIEFYNFSIKVLPESFSSNTGSAEVMVMKINPDCSFYEDIYPNYKLPPTQSQMDEVEELKNYTTQEYYDDFKYKFENQLECTKDEHCLGLRCPMSNLNCAYKCRSGRCGLEEGSRSVGADSNNDGVVSLQELVNYIQKWINGEVALNGLTNAIQSWISGGTSGNSGGSGGNNGTGSGSSGRPSDRPESGLVGYWNFDEGSGRIAYDLSGNRNDGVISDAGFVSGKRGKAIEFNGSGIVMVPHSDKLNFDTGSFTMLAWIKMFSPALDAPQHIIGKRDNSGGGNWVRLMTNNGYLIAEYSPGMQESSQSAHADGEWHQIALVKEDNENAFFYFDTGAMMMSIPANLSNTGELTIGKWDGENSFNGIIDEVKVYNRALGQDEIVGIIV